MYPMVRMGLAALIVVAIAAVCPTAQAGDSVVGSWRLLSWVQEDVESKAVQSVFGDNPVGVITYTSDGNMSVFIANPKRRPAGGPLPTDAEAADLYRTMIAYSGTYSIDGNKVTHKVEVSWNQAWNGTDQQRLIEVKDNRLTIKSPTMVSPISGKESINTLVWERMK
jgi:Lipocalin-like domain